MRLCRAPPRIFAGAVLSLIEFVQSRIALGRMVPTSLARANRLMRGFSAQDRLELCRPRSPIAASLNERLAVRPIAFREASAFVNMHHRHLASPLGHLFSIGCYAGESLVGVAIIGRPVARMLDDGQTCEITRVATTGTRNACSKLLGAARRRARARGFSTVITYTLADECGASLRAAGFVEQGVTSGGAWSTPSRYRDDSLRDVRPKTRWAARPDKLARRAHDPASHLNTIARPVRPNP